MSETNKEELLLSKHAFGKSSGIQAALDAGAIDERDILFLDEDTNPKIGWIKKNGEVVIVETGEDDVIHVEEDLPKTGEKGKIYIKGEDGYFWDGEKYVNLCKPTDVTELQDDIEALESEIANKVDADKVECSYEKIKYEVTDVPLGTIVKMTDNEIRIMCPSDSTWNHQSVGEGGDSNKYYMTFKTYVPNDDVTGYIEHLVDQVDEKVLTDLKTDKYGRKYQPTWLALAIYNEESDAWTYYGKNSTADKLIGWDYQIDWYNAEGRMIASDSIRINLSNEECHSSTTPYYVEKLDTKIENATTESKTYTDAQIEAAMEAMISAYTVVEF